MFRCRTFLLALGATVAACAATDPGPPPAGDPPAATTVPAPSWKGTMQAVEPHFDTVERLLLASPVGDLREVSRAATAAAELLREGYGRFEDRQIPGFATMARDAESWLLQVAIEARQAHGDLARELFRGGEARYCTRCHDAAKRVRG